MKAVVQRVARAAVRIGGEPVGQIGRGLLVLLGLGKTDTADTADWMINKLLALRIFPDDTGKMNRSVTDIGGGLLIVSQFTLYGVLEKGTRPSFSDAMPPAEAEELYGEFMQRLRRATPLPVAAGRFGAMMEVELVNDGPVTIIIQAPLSVGQASRLSPPENKHQGTGVPPVPLFQPFDPQAAVGIAHRHLPHWRQDSATYYVTFRLADSLPTAQLRQWHAQLETQQVADNIQRWLDAGHGECWLRQPAIATIVEQTLRHFDGARYHLGSFVIMPNHVHALVTPLGEHTLADILHSWKSYSAHQINHLLQRTGPVWQDESFDHLVRDEQALLHFEEYIRQNPQLAGLKPGEYRLGVNVGQPSRLSPPESGQAGRPSY